MKHTLNLANIPVFFFLVGYPLNNTEDFRGQSKITGNVPVTCQVIVILL